MTSLILGVIFMILVLMGSVEAGSLHDYLQAHSLIIVLGGTGAVLFFSNPMSVLTSVLRSLRMLGRKERSFETSKHSLLKLISDRQLNVRTGEPFIDYGVELWNQGVDSELFVVLLSQKKREMESRTLDAVQALKNLVKYPPALGMIGTVIGMIALFAKLDQKKDHLGVSLSMAMTATFLGLVLTNAVISPLADRLHVQHLREQRYLDNIYEILLLINRGEPASLIRGEMNQRVA